VKGLKINYIPEKNDLKNAKEIGKTLVKNMK
jgi:hypothetical protein